MLFGQERGSSCRHVWKCLFQQQSKLKELRESLAKTRHCKQKGRDPSGGSSCHGSLYTRSPAGGQGPDDESPAEGLLLLAAPGKQPPAEQPHSGPIAANTSTETTEQMFLGEGRASHQPSSWLSFRRFLFQNCP